MPEPPAPIKPPLSHSPAAGGVPVPLAHKDTLSPLLSGDQSPPSLASTNCSGKLRHGVSPAPSCPPQEPTLMFWGGGRTWQSPRGGGDGQGPERLGATHNSGGAWDCRTHPGSHKHRRGDPCGALQVLGVGVPGCFPHSGSGEGAGDGREPHARVPPALPRQVPPAPAAPRRGMGQGGGQRPRGPPYRPPQGAAAPIAPPRATGNRGG